MPLVMVLVALPLGLVAADSRVIEEIAVRVNDAIITRSDIARSRVQVQQELEQQYGADAPAKFAAKEKDILRDLIDQKLLVQRAKDNGTTVENDVIKRLDEMRKQMGLETMEELEKEAQKQGISFEDFKDNLRNQLLTQRVIGEEVGRKLNFSPTEVSKYYEEHKQEFVQPESVRLAEILVSTEAKANADGSKPEDTPEQQAARLAATEAKARELLDRIHKGEKFEDVAKQSSEGPTADQGGDLGEFKRGSLAKEIEEKVFTLPGGGVTDVIRTRQGYILLKASEHKEPGVATLKEAENHIQETLYYQKLQPALRQFLTKLREEAYIDMKPGFVDTGASPNQTKPVMTAAAAKSDDKKKKEKKEKSEPK